MKCPLFILTDTRAQLGEETEIGECIKEDCGAWEGAIECCSIVALAKVMVAIGNTLGRIHVELCLSKYTYTCHYCGVRIEKTVRGGER